MKCHSADNIIYLPATITAAAAAVVVCDGKIFMQKYFVGSLLSRRKIVEVSFSRARKEKVMIRICVVYSYASDISGEQQGLKRNLIKKSDCTISGISLRIVFEVVCFRCLLLTAPTIYFLLFDYGAGSKVFSTKLLEIGIRLRRNFLVKETINFLLLLVPFFGVGNCSLVGTC